MTARRTGSALPAPFRSGPFTVRADWIDENGHLNLAYYVLLFDWATDALWTPIGLGQALRARRYATFAAETHTFYRAELLEGETVVIDSQIIATDAKRLHIAHEMRRVRDDAVAAQQELMFLSVSLDTRRVTPWPESVAAGLREAAVAHRALPCPDWIGRQLTMPSRPRGVMPSRA